MSNNLEHIFKSIYHNNSWQSKQSVSGHGSTLPETVAIRYALPYVWQQLGITSLLDIPCGDFYWMKELARHLPHKYIGADIVPELITKNRQKWSDDGISFEVLDITHDPLPKVDMVLVRDCFGHLSNAHIWAALKNLQASGSTFLLATTFFDMKWSITADQEDGNWRPVNLAVQFKLGQPLAILTEGRTDDYRDKSLGLWRLNE